MRHVGRIAAIALFAARVAAASPYCDKVKDRAAADASLLFAPSVIVQGIRFPQTGAIDTATLQGNGYQLRASFEFSPLNFYKGFRVLGVGNKDCAQHEATARAAELLALGPDVGKLGALRRAAEYLDARKPEWQSIAQKSDERLAAHVISLSEDLEVRARVAELERRRVVIGGEIERIQAHGDPGPQRISELIAAIEATSADFESEASHVRTLDAWNVQLSGGVIPQSSPDFFGMITVSFNVGGVGRYVFESSYQRARAEEVRKARYETVEQLRRLRAAVRAALGQARREVEVIERSLATFTAARAALAQTDAPSAPHALAVLDLEVISVTADKTELEARAAELSIMEDDHGP